MFNQRADCFVSVSRTLPSVHLTDTLVVHWAPVRSWQFCIASACHYDWLLLPPQLPFHPAIQSWNLFTENNNSKFLHFFIFLKLKIYSKISLLFQELAAWTDTTCVVGLHLTHPLKDTKCWTLPQVLGQLFRLKLGTVKINAHRDERQVTGEPRRLGAPIGSVRSSGGRQPWALP